MQQQHHHHPAVSLTLCRVSQTGETAPEHIGSGYLSESGDKLGCNDGKSQRRQLHKLFM